MKLLAIAIIGLCVVIGINRHEISVSKKKIRTLEDVVTDMTLLHNAFEEDDNDVEM